MVPAQIEREIVIDAPVERVWAILTEAEHIGRWFAFEGAEVDLRPGGTMIFRWKEHGTFHAWVERVEPPRVFSYRGAWRPSEETRANNSTLVEFTLSPEGAGTRLRVVESGFRDLEAPETERAEYAEGNVQGWIGALDALQAHAREWAA